MWLGNATSQSKLIIYMPSILHPLLLFLWIAIGTGLRFACLTSKPPWTDEFATLVFSLGNTYQPVPLNEVISTDALLRPLQPHPAASIADVAAHLLSKDTHPPSYFILAHLWQQLFPSPGEYVSLWVARSLPAIFGVLSIPAIYALAKLAFRSRLVAQLAAAMMAVSPYGIFLAQEARHYTLATLLVIASLCCLVAAARYLWQRKTLPVWLVLLWIVINSLGIAVHYFFSLTLCAEAVALLVWLFGKQGWGDRGTRKQGGAEEAGEAAGKHAQTSPPPRVPESPRFPMRNFWRLGIVTIGTLIAGLVWLPSFLDNSYGSNLTSWIQSEERSGWAWLNPVFQALAAWITMLSLLPVEASSLPIVIVSGIVMMLFLIWALPILGWGFKAQWRQPNSGVAISILAGFVGGAIALFFAITYFLGMDLTRGARYNFVYFPAVIVLVGASLAACWKKGNNRHQRRGKTAVALIWLMGLLSSITVFSNWGYQKYYRPDLLVPIMQDHSSAPMLIATTHRTHAQTGEMMGIAWELSQKSDSETAQFFLAHQQEKGSPIATLTLQQALTQAQRPLALWLVNFNAPLGLDTLGLDNCVADSQSFPHIDGYDYQLYHCPAVKEKQAR